MKHIYNITLALFSLIALGSCEKEDDKVIAQGIEAPTLVSPNATLTLKPEADAIPALTMVWDHGDYDVNTPINYTIEVDNLGNEFAEALEIGTTSERFYTWTVKDLNTIALGKDLEAGTEGALEVRIKSVLGSEGFDEMISNIGILTITPYEAVVTPVGGPKFFMVGNFQKYYDAAEWTPTEAIRMSHIGSSDEELIFEAFVKLNEGDGFKFINDALDWGDLTSNIGTIGGAQDGKLENSGGSSDIKAPETGLFYVKVDITNLTYQLVKMDWGIIGDATPNGWDGETAMEYDFDNNKFTLSTNLVSGELKFRSQNASNIIFGEDWKFNVGAGDPVAADINDSNFTVTAGSATLELSFDFFGNAIISGI